MTIQEIRSRVAQIASAGNGDPEASHSNEDTLLWDFVRFLSHRDDDIGRMAIELLKSEELTFPRWCA